MKMYYLFVCFLLLITKINAQKSAVAHLRTEEITGTITFTETESGIHVTGSINGLISGLYGFHIHELGDTSTCNAAGGHFNPEGNDHGAPESDIRHVGDLGNIKFEGNTAVIDFYDSVLAFSGRNNILGRSLVLHAEEDDLGLGGKETSLKTGDAGARVACGVIGVLSPADPWSDVEVRRIRFPIRPILLPVLIGGHGTGNGNNDVETIFEESESDESDTVKIRW